MTQPDVLYYIEHVARELNVACAVRIIARNEHGLNVHVHVLGRDLDPALEHQRPLLAVVPYCTSREYFPQTVLRRWHDVPILNLACEQLLSPGNRRYRLPRDDFARSQVLHIAAGDFYRRWLLEAGVPLQHIVPAGGMTFQLYRDPYRKFFESRREELAAAHGLDSDLPWVFFPENFGAAFFSKSHIRQRIRGGYDRSELLAYVEYARRSFREIAKWCSQAAAIGRVEMIVRPRPAVSRSVFTDAFYGASESGPQTHLHFVKDGNVQEWILASQLVVSSYSTTLLEAAVAGQPAYLLSPFPVPESAASQWHKAAPHVPDSNAFMELVNSAENAPPADCLRQWADCNLLDYGDAITNVTRAIFEICSGARPTPTLRRPPFRAAVTNRVRDGLRRTERFLRQRLRPRRRRVFGHECDNIGQQAIEKQTTAWADVLDYADQSRAA